MARKANRGNIFGSDRGSSFDDSRFIESEYSLGGGVVMKRTDLEHGFNHHFGKGPRNWQRSDQSILDELCEVLRTNSALDATDLNIHIENGEVTLEGWVDTRDEKWLAEQLSESVLGVTSVENMIHLRSRRI